MHPELTASLRRVEEHYRADHRCRALFLTGSLASGTADDHSDVDVAAAFADDAYGEMVANLRPTVERLCGPVVAWLPEGVSPTMCNYAFLYRYGDEVLLYDFLTVKASAAPQFAGAGFPVIFDRDGLLSRPEAPSAPAAFTAERVAWLVDNWWVYCYLNGKYLRRGDVYKLAYVQGALLQTHVQLLNALLDPSKAWTWWAGAVKHLPADAHEALQAYLGAYRPDDVRAAVRLEMDRFAADARVACEQWQVPYPAVTEVAVRGHLETAGV